MSAALIEAARAFDKAGFRDWVARELPDDTIIGSSVWWADHLSKWAEKFALAAAAAPAQAPLTDEQVMDLPSAGINDGSLSFLLRFARAIERAHGIGGAA